MHKVPKWTRVSRLGRSDKIGSLSVGSLDLLDNAADQSSRILESQSFAILRYSPIMRFASHIKFGYPALVVYPSAIEFLCIDTNVSTCSSPR